jgi:hypothetical protein
MDLRWLTAPDDEVAEAMRAARTSGRPSWVPSRREVLARVNDWLILWYVCLVLMHWGIVTDDRGDGTVTPAIVAGLAGAAVILAASSASLAGVTRLSGHTRSPWSIESSSGLLLGCPAPIRRRSVRR